MAKKILLIDDDPHIVQLLKTRLVSSNYEVITAHDGEDGLLKLKEAKPDLVILDILMPKLDGYSFVLKMKEDESVLNIPVIMLTAKDNMKNLFEMEGVSGYMVKPFCGEDLLEKVGSVLGEK